MTGRTAERPRVVFRRAPAYATVQDIGRSGYMASGVPRSGAMDRLALVTLNAMLGNDSSAAAVEWALTGGEIELSTDMTFAFGGACADVTRNGEQIESYRAYHGAAGDIVTVRSIGPGRFVYIAFAGGIDVDVIMRSRSTYLPGGFGGFDGRRIRTADALPVGAARRRDLRVGIPLPPELRPPEKRTSLRFIEREITDDLLRETWSVSAASDRTGYRLSGPPVSGGQSIVSEAVCPGVVQLPPGGEPIVLMSDAPTVGGYRITGAVISADLGILAQLAPGETFTFESVDIQGAQGELIAIERTLERIAEWSHR
jgi:biotin-dependent carboxylase-like uncharacterized protein